MLDIQLLRNDLKTIATQLAHRGYTLPTANFETLEARRKSIQTQVQALQEKRNASSKKIGIAKQRGEDIAPVMAEVATLGDELKQAEAQLDVIQAELQQLFDSAGRTSTTRVKNFYRGLDLGNSVNLSLGSRLYNLIWLPLEPFLKRIKNIAPITA